MAQEKYYYIYDKKKCRAYKDDDGIVPHFQYIKQVDKYIAERLEDWQQKRYIIRVRK